MSPQSLAFFSSHSRLGILYLDRQFSHAADPALGTLEIHLELKDEIKLDPSSSRCVLLKDCTFSGSCIYDGKEAFNVICGVNLAFGVD